MFAVIFRAKPGNQDQKYAQTIDKMRTLAFEKYGCIDFIAANAGDQEVTISYWKDEQSIKNWKNDSDHLLAQTEGRSKWYEFYNVQIVEIMREYSYGAS